MDNYLIVNEHHENYAAILILLTQDSPLLLLNEIEAQMNILNIQGKVLIDQILRVGNTDERFVSFEINGTVNKDTFKFEYISKSSSIRKDMSVQLNHHNLIEHSTLSSIQKKMLKKGIAI